MTNANLGPAGWALPSQVPFPSPGGSDVAGRGLDISRSCCADPHNQSSQAPCFLLEECFCIPTAQPAGGWREGATGGRRNPVGLPGLSTLPLSQT